MKAITIRLYGPYEAMIKKMFEQQNPGCNEALECFLDLRVQSIRELRHYFSRAELTALVDMMNGTMFDPRFAVQKSALIHQVEDKELYDKMSALWKVDVKKLIAKIEAMPTALAFFLVYEIHRFWDEPEAYGSPSPNLEKFLDEYTRLRYRAQPFGADPDRCETFDTFEAACEYLANERNEDIKMFKNAVDWYNLSGCEKTFIYEE